MESVARFVERWLPVPKSLNGQATAALPQTTAPEGNARLRRARESFTNFLPWMEYQAETQTFLLEDGKSVAAVWQIDPIGTEGRTNEYKRHVRDKAFNIIANTIPEHDHNPWVLQAFVKDEPELSEFLEEHLRYRFGAAVGSDYTEYFNKHLTHHQERAKNKCPFLVMPQAFRCTRRPSSPCRVKSVNNVSSK